MGTLEMAGMNNPKLKELFDLMDKSDLVETEEEGPAMTKEEMMAELRQSSEASMIEQSPAMYEYSMMMKQFEAMEAEYKRLEAEEEAAAEAAEKAKGEEV